MFDMTYEAPYPRLDIHLFVTIEDNEVVPEITGLSRNGKFLSKKLEETIKPCISAYPLWGKIVDAAWSEALEQELVEYKSMAEEHSTY